MTAELPHLTHRWQFALFPEESGHKHAPVRATLGRPDTGLVNTKNLVTLDQDELNRLRRFIVPRGQRRAALEARVAKHTLWRALHGHPILPATAVVLRMAVALDEAINQKAAP